MTSRRSLPRIEQFRRMIGEIGLDTFITTVSGIILILVILLSWIAPSLYDHISNLHLFEALVLATLAQLLWAANVKHRETGIRVLTEEEAMEVLNVRIRQGGVSKVKILSAGLASRVTLISQLVNDGISVCVLAQDPEKALDRENGARVGKNLDTIVAGIRYDNHRRLLDIRYYPGIASTRAIMLYDKRNKPVSVFVGWYTYHDTSKVTRLRGFPNPTVVAEARSRWGESLFLFAENEFRRNVNEAGPNLLTGDGLKLDA